MSSLSPSAFIELKSKQSAEIAQLLQKFASQDPYDWDRAVAGLRDIGEENISADVFKLIERLRDAPPKEHQEIRRQLAHHGKVLELLLLLNSPKEEDWDRGREGIIALNDPYAFGALTFKLVCKFGSDNPRTHERARKQLIKIGPPAIQPLSAAIHAKNSDNIIRLESARTLGEIARCQEDVSPSAESALDELSRIATSRDPRIRHAAAYGLGFARHPRAIPTLSKLLLEDKDEMTRAEAAHSLGFLGADAVPHLAAAVDNYLRLAMQDRNDQAFIDQLDSALYIAVEATNALANIKEVESVDALISLLFKAQMAIRKDIIPHLANALKKLTGRDLGTDPKRWHEWREAVKKYRDAWIEYEDRNPSDLRPAQ